MNVFMSQCDVIHAVETEHLVKCFPVSVVHVLMRFGQQMLNFLACLLADLLTYLLTYLLTHSLQLSYGTRRFITVFT